MARTRKGKLQTANSGIDEGVNDIEHKNEGLKDKKDDFCGVVKKKLKSKGVEFIESDTNNNQEKLPKTKVTRLSKKKAEEAAVQPSEEEVVLDPEADGKFPIFYSFFSFLFSTDEGLWMKKTTI